MTILSSFYRKSFFLFLFLALAFTFQASLSQAASHTIPNEVLVAQAKDEAAYCLKTSDLQILRQAQSPQFTIPMRAYFTDGTYMHQVIELDLATNKFRTLLFITYNRDGSYRYGEKKTTKWKTYQSGEVVSLIADSCKTAILHGKVWDIRYGAYIPLD